MTIPEAAQLVIQAGAMGKSSEVFVLDMGESVKILDLINKMITLSGLTLKNSENPDGDIEIKIIGLRSGEKLYEELLLGEKPKKTKHPKILKASDYFIPFKLLDIELKNLKLLLNSYDSLGVKKSLKKTVNLYKSNSKIVDHIYIERKFSKKIKNIK